MKIKLINFLYLNICIISFLSGCAAKTSILLSPIFSNNMVLQQKTNAAIWGTAAPGKIIRISTTWSKKSYTAKTDSAGNWKIMVATPKFGGPYNIDISDGGNITLKNVMIGEVWLCSGQSNMEMPLGGWGMIKNYQKEIEEAGYPNIRLFTVQHATSNQPLEKMKSSDGGWSVCNAENITNFSAVAYFFAREVYKRTGIPIGLIQSSWSGTVAEAWTSGTTLQNMPDYAKAAKNIANTDEDKAASVFKKQYKIWQDRLIEKDSGYKQGKPFWGLPAFDALSWKTMKIPTYWELQGEPDFDGVIWFRKKIIIPESWAGKDIEVNLGTIDDEDITFFDGKKIGESKGANSSRKYTIPSGLVDAGVHVLMVRVFDTGGGGGIYGDGNILSLISANGNKIGLNGNWQYKIGLNMKDIPTAPVLIEGPNNPAVLYNAMINPLIQYTIHGVIWYQGENNVYNAYQYQELFPAMITDWRKKFKIGDFPFYFVQLANYLATEKEPVASAWAELREAQRRTLALPNTGMAVTIDIGEAGDIHPKNKQEVGRRLALVALAKTYGYKITCSGPVLQSYLIKDNKISLSFKFAEGGLKTKGGRELNGFAIAGADQQFHWAKAVILGNKVIVSSTDVPSPVAVRYAWANNPICNLYNMQGLPASPFRTDEWEGITFGNK